MEKKSPDLSLVAILIAVAVVASITIYRFEADSAATQAFVPSKREVWLKEARKRCNPKDIDAFLEEKQLLKPVAGYRAACLALANQLDEARAVLREVDDKERPIVVRTVFSLIHPIADSGDDVAAGPAMELVIEFWPKNVQAIYHAGIAAYENKDDERAKRHLEKFLGMHKPKDGFRKKAALALSVIKRIENGEKIERPVINPR